MSEIINKNRGLYIFESIVFILLGIAAIAIPTLFTYSIEILIGCLLVIGGLVQGFRSIKSQDSAGSMISAIIFLIVGILLLAFPITGIIALTLVIAIFFLIEGFAQLYLGFTMRELKGWGWMVFSGIVSLFLAGLIWSELPGSAAWVIGLLLGINLLIFGFSQLFLVLGTPKE
jgi:uncharacterized membrane protein HdeD (DUF308 family)